MPYDNWVSNDIDTDENVRFLYLFKNYCDIKRENRFNELPYFESPCSFFFFYEM